MSSATSPDARNKKLRPTVVESPVASTRKAADALSRRVEPPVPAASPVVAAPVVRQPTAIPGFERQRIAVQPDELERLSPGAASEVYMQAGALIAVFVVDKATERKAILWGHDQQKAYSDLVGQALTLSRSPVLYKVQSYLTRTMDILASIDLLAACGHGAGGVMDRMLQRVNTRIDTPGELASAQAELEKLVALMAAALEELLDFKDQLLGVVERTEAAGAQLEAAAIAASFLSQHLSNKKDAVAQRFAERAMSLTQTLALIREGGATRSLQLEQPISLVSAIQNVVLVMLPGFIGNIASITALYVTKTAITQTEAGEMAYRLRDIVEQLKSSTS